MFELKLAKILAAVAAAVLLTASPAVADLIDPVGDTFGSGSPQHDITTYVGDRGITPGSVVFNVNFAGAIAPPSAFSPNSVIGFIDLDTDSNAATGATPFVNVFSPPPAINLGDEFFVDLGSEILHPGSVDIVDALTNSPVGTATIAFTADGFSITIPLAMLGLSNTQDFNFGMVVGTFNEPTDRAPNGADPSSTIPEPASICIFALLFVGAGYLVRARLQLPQAATT